MSAPHARILLVEDETGVREVLAAHLRRQRYEVIDVDSGEAVLARMRAGELAYDLVLTDVHLPGMLGLELARHLHGHAPLKPILLMTGDHDASLAHDALDQGVTGYLLKPFHLFELDALIAQAASMLQLVETTETLARSQAEHRNDWGEAGGRLPRSWLSIGDSRCDAGDGHGARVVSTAGFLASTLGDRVSGFERDALRTAGRTHEIGRLLGPASPAQVARRTAQLLSNLGFHPLVPEVVRDAAHSWSPGVALLARILAVADRLDHDAARRATSGVDDPDAIRDAIDAVIGETRAELDPELVRLVVDRRASVESMWVLQRQLSPARSPARLA